MRRAALAGLLAAAAGCHNDWQQALDECIARGGCVGGAGGGAGIDGGGGTTDGGGVTLQWTPVTSATFATLEPGAQAELQFDLLNAGANRSGRIIIDAGAPFAVLNKCNNSNPLDPQDQCNPSITVRFAPTAPGDFTTQLIGREEQAGGVVASLTLTAHSAWALVPLDVRTDGGNGEGRVLVHVDGGTDKACPADCATPPSYPRTSTVQLTATGVGSDFIGWSGACSGTDASCSVFIDAGTSVTAAFRAWPRLEVRLLPDNMLPSDVSVTLDGGTFSCTSESCVANLKSGTRFQVLASGSDFARFRQFLFCGDAGTCSGVMTDAGVITTAAFDPYNRVFITQPLRLADPLGLPHFEGLCNGAQAVFPGTYWLPWLANALAPPSLLGQRGFVRMDGKPFIDQPFMTAAPTFYPPVIDLNGVDVSADGGPVEIATGTGGKDCTLWTQDAGLVGTGFATSGQMLWNDTGSAPTRSCAEQLRILCFQVDHNTPLPTSFPIPDGGRIAFLSLGQGNGAQSRSTVDARCNTEFGGGRQFVALRAEDAGISTLLSLDAGTWFRRDGVRLLSSASLLASTSALKLDAPLYQYADGTYAAPGVFVWTGADRPGGPAIENCQLWSSTTGTGASGNPLDSSSRWLYDNSGSCTGAQSVYCFEK